MDQDSRRTMIVGAALAIQAEHETDVALYLKTDPIFQMTYVVEGEECWLPVIACANGGYAEFPMPLRYTVALFFGPDEEEAELLVKEVNKELGLGPDGARDVVERSFGRVG
jgi:hypothetical protein